MSTAKPTIACFGATGGCVAATLACALRGGSRCTALVRTPAKLRDSLLNEHGISSATVENNLVIHQGNVKYPTDVAKVLVSPTNETLVVDVILSGIGAYPTFQWSIKRPFPLTDPTVCEDAVKTIFTALSNLSVSSISTTRTGQKPLLVVVSTAGCGRNRGVPLPVYPPYHYLLGGPLADKRRMEEVVLGDEGKHIRDFIIMRPLFLTNGEVKSEETLKVGWEWGIHRANDTEKEPGPTGGYFVSRKDVGRWIFDKAVLQGGWEGKCIYLSY